MSYFAKFKTTLKEAFKKGLLSNNLGEIIDSISPKDTHREFLFLNELQQLANTPCISEVVKKASLFSALTGLGFSDINSLDWSELEVRKGITISSFQQIRQRVQCFYLFLIKLMRFWVKRQKEKFSKV